MMLEQRNVRVATIPATTTAPTKNRKLPNRLDPHSHHPANNKKLPPRRRGRGPSRPTNQAMARPPTEDVIEELVLLALAIIEPLPMMLIE